MGLDREALNHWTHKRRKELDLGKVEKGMEAIGNLCPSTKEQEEILEGERAYFEKNKERMRYEDFRKQGYALRSESVEVGFGKTLKSKTND